MKRKAKAARKPRELYPRSKKGNASWCYICTVPSRHDYGLADIAVDGLSGKEARRLAKWLLQFADWADGKKERK